MTNYCAHCRMKMKGPVVKYSPELCPKCFKRKFGYERTYVFRYMRRYLRACDGHR